MGPDRWSELLAAATVGLLAWRWRRRMRDWSWIDRAGALLLVPALVVFWRLVERLVVGALLQDWNGCRLAPTVSVVHGYTLYYPATEGPILNTLYGPMTALAYLPVALFSTPTPVILTGAAMNVAFVVGPLLIFALRAAGSDPAGGLRATACWLGVCFLMACVPGSHYWLSMVHADAPALALGLLACVALLPRPGPSGSTQPGLLLAATLATLAGWTKQSSFPLGVSLAPFVWWAYGARSARRYLVWLVVVGAATTLLFATLFDVQAMWFNLVTVPSRHPWYAPGVSGLLATAARLAARSWPILAFVALAAIVRLADGRPSGERAGPAGGPWVVPLLPALALLPTGLLGANKAGGNDNSLHSLYFLLASGVALLVAGDDRPQVRRFARATCHAVCALGVVAAWRYGATGLRGPAPAVFPNDHQQAYAFARAHPGTAYFPWHPLSTLLAEGKLRHFSYGGIDRFIAGYAPTREHFLAHVPPDVPYVVARHRDWVMTYFPEYTDERRSGELPGWSLFTRP